MISSDFSFNQLGRLGSDITDKTQSNLSNTQYANYLLSNFRNESLSDEYIRFATNQPDVHFRNFGISPNHVDQGSSLMMNKVNDRHLEKLQLFPRPFLTVPYLGRGSADASMETQLRFGESVMNKKSVSTVMDKSYIDYNQYPLTESIRERVTNPKYSIEEQALDGWVRGGAASRQFE